MARTATPASSRLRRRGVRLALLALILAVALPALTQQFNAFILAGFPAGFYLAAEGLPVVLAALVVLFAARADRLEQDGGSAPAASAAAKDARR